MRYALEIEMDGSQLHGTNRQNNEARTLQGLCDTVLTELEGTQTHLYTAGRLDKGVCAHALPCHVDLSRNWDPRTLGKILNARTPECISVVRAARVTDNWVCRSLSQGKTYAYRVLERGAAPTLNPRCWWKQQIPHPTKLHELSQLLIGTHDLSGFACLRHDDTDTEDAVRIYSNAHWNREELPYNGGTLWTFRITGIGFLYKQVRGIVGSLVAAAIKPQLEPIFRECLTRGRTPGPRCGTIAPAHGLALESVTYGAHTPDWEMVE